LSTEGLRAVSGCGAKGVCASGVFPEKIGLYGAARLPRPFTLGGLDKGVDIPKQRIAPPFPGKGGLSIGLCGKEEGVTDFRIYFILVCQYHAAVKEHVAAHQIFAMLRKPENKEVGNLHRRHHFLDP